MFRQRLLAALVLVPIVLVILGIGPSWTLAGVLLFMVAASAYEWTKLIPIQRLEYRFAYLLLTLMMLWLGSQFLEAWLNVALIVWVFAMMAILSYPYSQKVWGYRPVVALIGLLFLSAFANSFVALFKHDSGRSLVVYVLFLIWATDTGAYLIGKYLGKHKLIPKVSPGKTIEGTIGGMVAALGIAYVGFLMFEPSIPWQWYLLAIFTVLFAMFGDLLISMFKRRVHLKDTGHVIPGHGGLLDRLDSSIAALPFFYYGLHFLESLY